MRPDGHVCKRGEYAGYSVIHGPATFVEVAVPPEKVAPFHIVSVELLPDRLFEGQDETPS